MKHLDSKISHHSPPVFGAWLSSLCVNILGLVLTTLLAGSPVSAQFEHGKLTLANRFIFSRDMHAEQETMHNWLDLDFLHGEWTVGGRLELHNPENPQRYKEWVSQRYVEFRHDWLQVRAGNFYERLGRGLVFHAFEIQSQAIDRTEQNLAIDRNIDGLNVKVLFDKFEAIGLWGKPLQMLSSLRSAPLGGGEIKFRPISQLMLGGTYLQFNGRSLQTSDFPVKMYSGEFSVDFEPVGLFAEIARKHSANPFFEPNGNAVYVAANLAGEIAGFTAEFKRYEHFNSVFNNPPALVKTHSFALLNRHTHTLNANDEIGFQFEGYISPSASQVLTLHVSGADNLKYSPRRRFREVFLQSESTWEALNWRILFDYSKDQPVGDLDRRTAAGEFEFQLSPQNSLLVDGQIQRIENENRGQFWNVFGLIAFSRSPWLTLSLQYERTTDVSASRRHWPAAILSIKANEKLDFLLTLGSRPAGLVCSGGICFFVPEFQGAELRWNLRF